MSAAMTATAAPSPRARAAGRRSCSAVAVASPGLLDVRLAAAARRARPASAHAATRRSCSLALLPLLLAVVLAEIAERRHGRQGGRDARRARGDRRGARGRSAPGTAGIEPVFFLLVLGGRVFGAGLRLRARLRRRCSRRRCSPAASARGCRSRCWRRPGSGWAPGCCRAGSPAGRRSRCSRPTASSRRSRTGSLMNLWLAVHAGHRVPGHTGGLAFVPGAPLVENLHRFLVYTLLTSTCGWDTGRAITNRGDLLVLGPAVLATLRRAVPAPPSFRLLTSRRGSGASTTQDPVVAVRGVAAAVGVGGGHPQRCRPARRRRCAAGRTRR